MDEIFGGHSAVRDAQILNQLQNQIHQSTLPTKTEIS